MPKRILIADDEPNIVTALEFLLRRSGFSVEVARNGEDALERVEAAPPDLVLLDVMMPKLSGYDVCRRIRANAAVRRVPPRNSAEQRAAPKRGVAVGLELSNREP